MPFLRACVDVSGGAGGGNPEDWLGKNTTSGITSGLATCAEADMDSLPVNVRATVNAWKVDTMILRRICYFISDCVVVWRTWCLWQYNKWVKMFLTVVLLATFATSLSTALITITGYPSTYLSQNLLGTFCLLFTNFGTTALCAYKVWEYRRSIKSTLAKRSNTFVENVLLLLVESGSLYCIFWLLLLLGDFSYLETGPLGPTFGLEWFMPHFSGIYVSMIILVVAMYKHPSDTFVSIADSSANTLGGSSGHTKWGSSGKGSSSGGRWKWRSGSGTFKQRWWHRSPRAPSQKWAQSREYYEDDAELGPMRFADNENKSRGLFDAAGGKTRNSAEPGGFSVPWSPRETQFEILTPPPGHQSFSMGSESEVDYPDVGRVSFARRSREGSLVGRDSFAARDSFAQRSRAESSAQDGGRDDAFTAVPRRRGSRVSKGSMSRRGSRDQDERDKENTLNETHPTSSSIPTTPQIPSASTTPMPAPTEPRQHRSLPSHPLPQANANYAADAVYAPAASPYTRSDSSSQAPTPVNPTHTRTDSPSRMGGPRPLPATPRTDWGSGVGYAM
ncbi:hypothetical protein CYLTODRAFT_246884 [Cylindrobasidium torrendii FP15055 ss-10]|uniref:Transmembrane protein n=1 Tax=Cylindrobasidium torrendii FP15055 ss-10 TaxID=1314674 RepID=A0A0D7BEN7_9AGAR|nr:hypothetical protein CYLTODRAFT_246884 [Cylindrobasidium torrendii FP15055 ss-10]